MEKPYHIIGKDNTEELAKLLAKDGQGLLPMVEPTEQSKLAADELIDVLGRARAGHDLAARTEGAGRAASAAEEGSGRGRRGADTGLSI